MEVIVVGGGASGLVAAISAAKGGHTVTILEHKDRVGKKILATGNGRCNLTNLRLKDKDYSAYDKNKLSFVTQLFDRFDVDDTMDFFRELGLEFKNRDGLVYPNSDQASSVLDVLRYALDDLGVKIICDCHVREIKKHRNGFEVYTDTDLFKAQRVILAAGLMAQSKLGADGSGCKIASMLGHRINEVTPGLVQIRCKEDYFKSVSGVRIPAELTLMDQRRQIYSEKGELQLTQYGVSGIVAMNLSNRFPGTSKDKYIIIDTLPNFQESELTDILDRRIEKFGNSKRPSSSLFTGLLPKKLGDLFLRTEGINPDRSFSEEYTIIVQKASKLAESAKRWKVSVLGTNSFEDAQICLGGISLSEVKETMESTIIPGLYLCGEILDVHGDCGGYNLQLAWSSGYVAGRLEE